MKNMMKTEAPMAPLKKATPPAANSQAAGRDGGPAARMVSEKLQTETVSLAAEGRKNRITQSTPR
ncbi:MAG TPA: hypothetical protein VMY37_38060 [Thermoguttaceae bacterium]|nr:hypothetical protein [Thermoguttaceae bacterium]